MVTYGFVRESDCDGTRLALGIISRGTSPPPEDPSKGQQEPVPNHHRQADQAARRDQRSGRSRLLADQRAGIGATRGDWLQFLIL